MTDVASEAAESRGETMSAFGVFVKTFASAFSKGSDKVDIADVVAVYCPSGKLASSQDKDIEKRRSPASRILGLSRNGIVSKALACKFGDEQRSYTNIEDLVNTETRLGSIASIIADDNATGGNSIRFVKDEDFREKFTLALVTEGMAGNIDEFWQYVDSMLNDHALNIERQLDIVATFVLASLSDTAAVCATPLPQQDSSSSSESLLYALHPQQLHPVVWDKDKEEYRDEGRPHLLNQRTPTCIGRSRFCCAEDGCTPLVVDNNNVSRKHCKVTFDGAHWLIIDYSTNGTYIVRSKGDRAPGFVLGYSPEDEQCEPEVLEPGDIICLAPAHDKNYKYDCTTAQSACFRFDVLK